MRVNNILKLASLGLLALACGDDDDKNSGGGGPKSFAAISETISSPTGTVEAATVGPVAEEFEKLTESAVGGVREEAVPQQDMDLSDQLCTAGGSATASGSGDQNSGSAKFEYKDCCVAESCCINGGGNVYFSTEAGAAYMSCGYYDIQYACEGVSANLKYSSCLSSDGKEFYSVTVNSETYAVSGHYSNGNGTLEIRGANGSWTCTYTEGSGSCTGEGGDFEF